MTHYGKYVRESNVAVQRERGPENTFISAYTEKQKPKFGRFWYEINQAIIRVSSTNVHSVNFKFTKMGNM